MIERLIARPSPVPPVWRVSEESTCSKRFFFSSRRRHTRWNCDWSSDVCSSDLRKAARRGEDSNFFAQTCFDLWLDLLHEYLQAVVNRAMQRVFKEDAIDHAVVVIVAVVNRAHHRSEERRVGKECRSRWSA